MGYILKAGEKWAYNDGSDNGKIIKDDGSYRAVGTAVLYDDIIGNVFGARLNSTAGKVDYSWDENALKFQPGGNITNRADRIQINMQMPHKMVFGSAAFFSLHFHWWQEDTVQRTLTLQYRIQNNNEAKNTTWQTITAVTGTGSDVFGYTSGVLNQITYFPEIDVTGVDISSTIQWRMARTDSETGDLLAYFVDAHYAIDSDGSMDEWSKN